MGQATKRPGSMPAEPGPRGAVFRKLRSETRQKKAARRLAPSSGRVQGLRRERLTRKLYQIPGRMQAPIRTGKEVFPVTGWEVVLTMIGTGWLTGRLFRLIDWIERS